MTQYESIHWQITLGLQPGYHTEQQNVPSLQTVGEIYQNLAESVYQETGIYISASLTPAKTVYRQEWGSPPGGEETVILMGCYNPEFAEKEAYIAVLKQLAGCLQREFQQTTLMLEIMPADIIYMKNEGETK